MIKILFFAQLREQVGQAVLQRELAGALSLEQLLQQLIRDYPQAEAVLKASRFAVNQVYVPELGYGLQAGDEVALIPPVSGG